MQRVYRLLNKDFEVPKKVLELNPRHAILLRLNQLAEENPLGALVIEQVYENALLIEGLHPEPAGMVSRIQKLIESALE
jgi:molecular chaperone HtpG